MDEQAVGSNQGQEAEETCHNCPTCAVRKAGSALLI